MNVLSQPLPGSTAPSTQGDREALDNWLNEGAIRYVWRDMPAEPVVPQILVIERDVQKGDDAISVGGERLVKRLQGTAEIEAWVQKGAAI